MSAPVESSGGGLRFAVLGVPVTVRLSVVLVLGFLGYGSGDVTTVVLFIVIGLVSILVHELGHALVARAAGTEPRIELAGFGGVTQYAPNERSSTRVWSLAIGLAGPAVGIAVGLVAIVLRSALGPTGGLGGIAWQILIFTSIGWSVLNLLPIPPLDGGQAMTQLLPGDRVERRRRGAFIGIGTAALGLLAGLWFGQTFAAIFAVLFGFQNLQTVQALRGKDESTVAEQAAPTLADRGTAIREWFAAGNGDLEQLAQVQERAAAEGEHQLAAELGEVALQRGSDDPSFAVRTARAWFALGVENRALRALEAAVALGADRERLQADPTLRRAD